MKPTYPNYFFQMPFAQNGDKYLPPVTSQTPGRADLTSGFPPITQKPISQGGIAPDRGDFNGLFYEITALLFWLQSGGQIHWSNEKSYVPPCIVNYGGVFYAALAESGPETAAGAKTPDKSPQHWQNLFNFLADKSPTGGVVKTGNTVTLTGDTRGSAAFDINGNVSIPNSVANAAQSQKLATARSVTFTGDVASAFTFDGTTNVSTPMTVNQASKLRTPRQIALVGDVTGSATFDGTANVNIAASIVAKANNGVMVPNWNEAVSFSSLNYTAPTNGFIQVKRNWVRNTNITYQINNFSVDSTDYNTPGFWYSRWLRFPVAKGDVFKITGDPLDSPSYYSMYFIPAKQ